MTYNEILSAAQSLSETERQSLLQALSVGNQCEATVPESSRLSALLEKQGCCPHCGSNRYLFIVLAAVGSVCKYCTDTDFRLQRLEYLVIADKHRYGLHGKQRIKLTVKG